MKSQVILVYIPNYPIPIIFDASILMECLPLLDSRKQTFAVQGALLDSDGSLYDPKTGEALDMSGFPSPNGAIGRCTNQEEIIRLAMEQFQASNNMNEVERALFHEILQYSPKLKQKFPISIPPQKVPNLSNGAPEGADEPMEKPQQASLNEEHKTPATPEQTTVLESSNLNTECSPCPLSPNSAPTPSVTLNSNDRPPPLTSNPLSRSSRSSVCHACRSLFTLDNGLLLAGALALIGNVMFMRHSIKSSM